MSAYIHKQNKHTQKRLYKNIHNNFICNSPKSDTPKNQSTVEWTNNFVWFIHMMNYYSTIKQKKILIEIQLTWINLKNIICGTEAIQKSRYCDFACVKFCDMLY